MPHISYHSGMPRRGRSIVGGMAYHVLNRAVGRQTLFEEPADYDAFERVLEAAHQREPLRILGYCVMPNHWHLVLWPLAGRDDQVSEFMRWLTVTHTQRWHAHFHTSGTGPIYQGRFKSFPVQDDAHLWTLLRYVERNPRRANLVKRAEQWRHSSLWRWTNGDAASKRLLSELPSSSGRRPRNWADLVNRAETEAEVEAIRRCVKRGSPYGEERWRARTVERLGLESTLRSRGRPRKVAT